VDSNGVAKRERQSPGDCLARGKISRGKIAPVPRGGLVIKARDGHVIGVCAHFAPGGNSSVIDVRISPPIASQPMVTLAPDREQPIRLSLSMVATIVVGFAFLRLMVASHSGLVFDEGYYTFWSERLATGYLDHPPAVAIMIALGRFLAGNSPLGVRFVAVVMGIVLSGLIWRTGELLLDRRTALVAVIWYNVTPVAGLDFLTTPDPPSALFWMATIWAVAEFTVSGQRGWWLVAGLMAGLGLWSKYTVAFVAPGLLLLLLTDHERRRWLAYWQFWAGGVIALIVFSPVIWWNAQHQWASFLFQGQRTVTPGISPDFLGNVGDLLSGQALYMTPILCGFAIAGAVMFFRASGRPDRAGLALPVLTTLPALAYFCYHTLHAQVDANWLIPLWPPLSLAGAFAAVALWDRRPALGRLVAALQIGIGLAATLFVYVQAIYHPFPLGDLDRTNETRGWANLDSRLEELAANNHAHWIATSHDYAGTGEIESYLLFDRSPLPVRQIDEPLRWAFLPPFNPDAAGWPALFVETEANVRRPTPPSMLFGQTRLLDVFNRQGGNGPLETWSVFLVGKPTPAFYAGLGEEHN
jgi:Dolichyl-phosphate-mannose-protein mannosyltransferase